MQFIYTLREKIILTPGFYEIMKGFIMYHTYNSYHNMTQDVVLTSIQRHLNVMDVRWTLKQRCVLTGKYDNYVNSLFSLFLYRSGGTRNRANTETRKVVAMSPRRMR